MSAHWDCTLSLPNLPKKLTSRRNLHTYFSKFGDILSVSVNKVDRSGIVQFSSHSEAKVAKTLGKICDGKPLKILWSKNISENKMDPRSKDHENVEIDSLWQDDDKECFGIERKSTVEEIKKSAKEMISQHLKLPGVKKRLGSIVNTNAVNQAESSDTKISPIKLSKTLKSGALKKTIVTKRKLLRKEGISSAQDNKRQQAMIREPTNQSGQTSDQIDLKQRLSLLDERDKLIRQKTIPDSNIKTAVTMKGTCPDMCPEKERILRQCGHAVAVYEMLPGTTEMDENKAVKEYIRSSADQEVPLPHDLRPGPVLSMTMSYLITNIINKVDNPNENKAVWYSFCWNRLRSIRKDIILQQLCDLETVKIVEQCARFHICCYDHMWDADVSGFDDKINTKILMDCLQTLKHLYEDLAKRNIKCSNESEFYSYLILLNLTTGEVIWDYQQYAPEVQVSREVQFAIAVYMSFKNNMYSKYFNLVKQASYLEACLLQRYFHEVRTKALKMMLKAYSLPNRNVGLTTSFLMKSLKFDSKKNVLKFCEKVDVVLDKKIEFEVDENEEEYISKSSFLIREKRLPIANAVVGENNPLPMYIPRQVHSSFDEFGKLGESFQLVPDETYDSPLDESDVSISEDRSQSLDQSKSFKFSLSPKIIEENIFGKNVFSRLGPHTLEQDGLINEKSPEVGSILKSSKLQFHSNDQEDDNDSFYKNDNNEDLKMEQGIDEELVYDEGYDEEANKIESEIPKQSFTQFGFEDRSFSEFQQPFSSTPITHITPTKNKCTLFQEKENHSGNSLSTIISPKSKTGGKFVFSLATPTCETVRPPIRENATNDIPMFGRTVQFQQASSQSQPDKTNPFLLPKHDIKPVIGVEISFSPQRSIRPSEENLEKIKENKLKTMEKEKKEMLEKLILEKAEAERMKMEETRRAELEKEKKRIKEQKALERLRKDLRQRMKAKNAKKYARIWKFRVEKLKEKRADFPMLYELSVESHLKLWGRKKYIPTTSVSQRAKDRQHLNIIVSQLLKNGVTDSCKYIGQELAELLAKSAARTMSLGRIQPIYWKLAMSLPWIDRSTSEFSVFHQMMRRCCRQTFYKESNAQLGDVEFVMTSLKIPVNMCINFSDDLESCSGLNGMDALIFIVVDGFESEKTCLDRLRNLVTSQARSSEFSVSVMTINGDKFDRVLKMELKELHEQNLIAYWTVNAWTNSDCLLENLGFLAEHLSVVQDVRVTPLESLITEALDDFIYDVERSQAYCPNLIAALQNPNSAINIYNTFLTKLEDLLLSSKLEKYFNFAAEFKTHIQPNESGGPELMCGKQYNNQYKLQISNKINSLKLPELSGWPVHTNKIDFNSLADLVETYCRTKINDMEVVKRVIRRLAQEDVADPTSHVNCYSWLHIVEMWAESKMCRLFSTSERGKKMFVMYNKNDLQRMIKKQWWILLPVVANASDKL